MPHMLSMDYEGNLWVTGELDMWLLSHAHMLTPALNTVLSHAHMLTPALNTVLSPNFYFMQIFYAITKSRVIPSFMCHPSCWASRCVIRPAADVGLHQALKFSKEGQLLMELGTKLTPGSGPDKLCKPTQAGLMGCWGPLVP
jgi:hypothetical protein